MIPFNPHYVRELMADRERQIEKIRLSNEIRRVRQEMKMSTTREPRHRRPLTAALFRNRVSRPAERL